MRLISSPNPVFTQAIEVARCKLGQVIGLVKSKIYSHCQEVNYDSKSKCGKRKQH